MAAGYTYNENEAIKRNIAIITDTGVRNEQDTTNVGYMNTGIGSPVLTDAIAASGTLTFAGNASAGDTVPAINGFGDLVFVASGAVFPEINLGATRALSIANLAGALNAAVAENPVLYPQLAAARYTAAATLLTITAVEPGVGGNAITLGTNTANITRSAATLADGAAAIFSPAGVSANPLVTSLPSGAATNAGAPNIAIGQVTAGVASGVLVAARATRRSVTIRNQDDADSAYIGTGTVTSGNGFLLKFGESISIDSTAALNCIRATGDVQLAILEVYDA